MPSHKARKRAQLAVDGASRLLHSEMSGNGGRFAPNNGHPDIEPAKTSPHEPAEPAHYRVLGTTSSEYSTTIAGNTTMIWRDER